MQDINILKNSYLIIGGPCSKKSEVSRKIAKLTNYKLINLDREKYSYFEDFTDFDSSKYYSLKEKDEILSLKYIHKYEMKHLNYVLDNISSEVVIDFGNTYLIINDENILNKLKLFSNIILLENNNYKSNNKLDKLLYKNKILSIATIKININDDSVDDIVEKIENKIKFKDIL